MKFLITWAFLFSAGQAFAWPTPQVGDRAQLKHVTISNHADNTANVTFEITEYNPAMNQYKVTQTFRSGTLAKPVIKENWVDPEKLLTNADMDQILADCANNGGTLEKITVKAGEFDTCRVVNGVKITHYGKVPFGIIREQIAARAYELESFTAK